MGSVAAFSWQEYLSTNPALELGAGQWLLPSEWPGSRNLITCWRSFKQPEAPLACPFWHKIHCLRSQGNAMGMLNVLHPRSSHQGDGQKGLPSLSRTAGDSASLQGEAGWETWKVFSSWEESPVAGRWQSVVGSHFLSLEGWGREQSWLKCHKRLSFLANV